MEEENLQYDPEEDADGNTLPSSIYRVDERGNRTRYGVAIHFSAVPGLEPTGFVEALVGGGGGGLTALVRSSFRAFFRRKASTVAGSAIGKTFGNRSVGAAESLFRGKKITKELARTLDIDRRQLGKAIEKIKKANSLSGGQNVKIGRTSGDVFDESGEYLGNVFDEVVK